MQVFSGIYLNFAGPAAVVEKTVFPEMFVGRFSERWFAILAFCAPRAVASMTAACALPRSSDAALAAYERGGVHGIVVALGLQSNSGLRLREQPVSRLTGGRLLAASVGGDGERRGSEGPAVSDLRSEAAASSAQMMDCITACSWPPQIPPSLTSSARPWAASLPGACAKCDVHRDASRVVPRRRAPFGLAVPQLRGSPRGPERPWPPAATSRPFCGRPTGRATAHPDEHQRRVSNRHQRAGGRR